jgi:hypothetical protein
MKKSEAVSMLEEGSGLREVWALKQAVELLGFDADALVRRMCESTEPYWQRLALRSATVLFDPSRTYFFEPSISEPALAAADAWLTSVRLIGSPFSLGTDSRPSRIA